MDKSRAVGWRDWHQKLLATRPGESTRTERRGVAAHPVLAAGRAQLGESGGAAGRRRHHDQLRRVWVKWLRGELRLLLPSQSRHFLPPRSAETHVQPVSGAVVSSGGRTGRPGRPAPQVKAALGLAKFTQKALSEHGSRQILGDRKFFFQKKAAGRGVKPLPYAL